MQEFWLDKPAAVLTRDPLMSRAEVALASANAEVVSSKSGACLAFGAPDTSISAELATQIAQFQAGDVSAVVIAVDEATQNLTVSFAGTLGLEDVVSEHLSEEPRLVLCRLDEDRLGTPVTCAVLILYAPETAKPSLKGLYASSKTGLMAHLVQSDPELPFLIESQDSNTVNGRAIVEQLFPESAPAPLEAKKPRRVGRVGKARLAGKPKFVNKTAA